MPELIEARGITKRFPGVVALDDVDFTLRGGEVHALVGENGAGKSTLMKILGGIYHADAGRVSFEGTDVAFETPLEAQRSGIAVIHQELNLMPDLTVAQNIFFGREPRRGFKIDDDRMRREARTLMTRLGVEIEPDVLLRELTVAAQQMVEIAKALALDARVLIMDEPTAALSAKEVDTLFDVIREFSSPQTAVVYISHRLEEIQEICNQVTVLRDGSLVGTYPASDLSRDDMIGLMVGRAVDMSIRPNESPQTAYGLEVSDLNTDLLQDVNFSVHRGEIFGLAGLVGAGRTETARAISGADPKDSGTVKVAGKVVDTTTPETAVRAGIGYLSEDRKQYGLLLDKDIVTNVALPSLDRWSNASGVVNDRAATDIAEDYRGRLNIKTPSVHQTTKNLSGGNQQKVVLAKWMARDCDVLFFDEPTRGIDVGAKEEIYNLLESLAEQGKTIVVVSSEIPELLRLCQRIAVMCQGRITGVIDNADATQEKIMDLATQFEVIGKKNDE